jgi:hypothetical protein
MLLALAVVGSVVLAGAEPGGVEAFGRPKVTWALSGAPILDIDTCPSESFQSDYDSKGNLTKVTIALCPGGSRDLDFDLTADSTVFQPRAILQTASGARVLRIDPTNYGPQIGAGATQSVRLHIEIPPAFRATRASGRIYLRDRGSVLGPPLDVQLVIVQPTPEERALTPVIIPTNHIRLLADRFNIRALTVIAGTNVTWTNYDTRQHRVVGRLCTNLSGPCAYAPQSDPSSPSSCPRGLTNAVANPATQSMVCIDSGPINSQGKFTVKLTRPDPLRILRYEMDDAIDPDPEVKLYTGCRLPGDSSSICFLTVK